MLMKAPAYHSLPQASKAVQLALPQGFKVGNLPQPSQAGRHSWLQNQRWVGLR